MSYDDVVMVKCQICEDIFESSRVLVELEDDGWDICSFCDKEDVMDEE